ncbi:phosphoribosylglycinamide formyltransferase [Bacteroidia bacterium]|nr:phosphoribosylglycinamide formyltransferase [Bacteroidia bacterium]
MGLNTQQKNIAVFASGNGSNFEAIAGACERGELAARVALMVCDHPDAYVVQRAAHHGVQTFAFDPKNYNTKADYEAQILQLLDAQNIDLVCLAGYMRLISKVLLDQYEGRIINIHPSLLPAFKGAHAIEQAVDYGVKVFGVTVHFIDSTMDGGRIIAQRAFAYEGSDASEVERRIHEIEHKLYIDVIQQIITQK